MPYEITLQKLLESTDKELHGRLLHLEKLAKPLLSYTQGKFPYFTPHDFHHSISVEENLNWLIPDKIKEKFNKYELFFLISAAWLHDWGMIGTEDELPEEVRENHHLRTENYFETKYNSLGFTLHEGRIIGRICKGHRIIDLHSKEYDDMTFGQGIRIQIRFLSALLRIADETDITHSRTPEVIYYTLNPSGASEDEFKKHLNISGIGQLDEPHKIYITGIVRDPKGAQTLRNLAIKIQRELDSVKSILTQNGLFLDVVELKMETRGFIDKPIAFEINRNKIVDLLIGKHLYGKVDVAIRELVQNSIDTCKLKSVITNKYVPTISLVRLDNNTLIISDNGSGMSFSEAKRFLSSIGTSFYQSDEFKKTLGNKVYDPISYFGIGLLSSFLIADGLTIETKKQDEESCKFTISSLSEDWKYEKGSLKDSGTIITLVLNVDGKRISILESLNRYFIASEIPISYKEVDKEEQIFGSTWTIDDIKERFLEDDERKEWKTIEKIIELNEDEYDVFLVKSNFFNRQLILFNHGVFINRLNIVGLNYEYCIFINLKANIIDLHLSRENVIENDKYASLIYNVFNEIFNIVKNSNQDPNYKNYISFISDILENRVYIEKFDFKEMSLKFPLLSCFLDNIVFPLVKQGRLEYSFFNEILESDQIPIYYLSSNKYNEEITLFLNLNKDGSAVFNPYKMPEITEEDDDIETINLFEYIYLLNKPRIDKIDLRNLLLSVSKPNRNNYSKILPANVQFASFGKLKPFIVVLEYPIVTEKYHSLGFSYWGNILLWQKLTEKERLTAYKKHFMDIKGGIFESVELVKEPVVLIDSSDPFISAIIAKYDNLNPEECLHLQRYFHYLSYLPSVFLNLESCIIFLEAIENIEKLLCKSLSIQRPPEIFKRMKPNSSLYLQYFKNTVMNFETF